MKSFLKKEINSFKNAFNGIKLLISSEKHFQFHLIALFISILINLILKISLTEWAIITLCYSSVLAAEAINTAIEKILDGLHPARANWIKESKDIAAAAVLLCAIGSLIIACFIWLPKIIDF